MVLTEVTSSRAASIVTLTPPPTAQRATSAPDAATLAALLNTPVASPLSSPPSPIPITSGSSPSTEELAQKRAAERAVKRTKLLGEINDTERHYSASMSRVLNEYIVPLRSNGSESGVKAETVSAIFSNIEQLASFHAVLSAEMAKAVTPTAVCTVFLKFVDYLKMYIPYVNGYSEGVKALTSLQDNKRWQRFCAERKQSMGLDLTSFLIMPVQRIPRYELLLKELKRNLEPPARADTPTDEALLLDETLNKIVSVAQKVNEAKREAERVATLLAVSQRVAHIDSAFPQSLGGVNCEHRRLIREGNLSKRSTFGRKQRNCYLFNDVFLWCSSYRYKGHVGTVGLKAAAIDDKELAAAEEDREWTLEVSHPEMKTLLLTAESSYERQQWLAAFVEAAEEARQLDPQVAESYAKVQHHERALSVSTSRPTVSVDGSPSQVSAPSSPHPGTLAEGEEEDDEDDEAVEWHRNALKGDDEEKEPEQQRQRRKSSSSRITAVTGHRGSTSRPSHSRKHSNALDIKPTISRPAEGTATGATAADAAAHQRKVSVVVTAAAHSRSGSGHCAEQKEETERPRKASTVTLNTPPPSAPPAPAPAPPAPLTARSTPAAAAAPATAGGLSSLSRNDMTVLKRMKSPPLPVKLAIESLAIILDLPIPSAQSWTAAAASAFYWTAIQSQLVKPTFMSQLLALDSPSARLGEDQCRRLRGYVFNPALSVESVRECSATAAVLWCWVRSKWAESSGEALPNEVVKDKQQRVPVVAKVDSGRTPGQSRPTSVQSSRTHTRQSSRVHSRQGSITAASPFVHPGVMVSTSRVSPSTVTSPAAARPGSRQAGPVSRTAKDALTSPTASAGAGKRGKNTPGCGLGSLEHKALHVVFSSLSFQDVFHPRSSLASVNRRFLNSALHLLLSLNLTMLSTLSTRSSSLKASLTASLTAATLRTQLTVLSSTRSHLTAALSSVTASNLKAIRALVKPPSSMVPVFEGVLLTMELREGAKERRRKDKEQRDMTLVAHKAVVGQTQLLPFLSSLTPRYLLPFIDAAYLSRLQQLVAGLDPAAVEKSSPLAGPWARWLVAVWEWTEWCRATGGAGGAQSSVVQGLVELEDSDWRLKAASVMGMSDGDDANTGNDAKAREYATAMGVARALRGR